MSDQEKGSFHLPMSRRAFPLVTAGLVVAINEIACKPTPDQIFPDTPIDRDFFTQENIHKLVQLSDSFTNIPTVLPIQRRSVVSVPAAEDFYRRTRVKSFGIYSDEDDHIGINLEFKFEDQVFLGKEYRGGSTNKPVFLMAFKKEPPVVHLTYAPETVDVHEGDANIDPLREIDFKVNLLAREVDQTNLIVIINKGLLNDHIQRAFVLPIRLNVQYIEPTKRAV